MSIGTDTDAVVRKPDINRALRSALRVVSDECPLVRVRVVPGVALLEAWRPGVHLVASMSCRGQEALDMAVPALALRRAVNEWSERVDLSAVVHSLWSAQGSVMPIAPSVPDDVVERVDGAALRGLIDRVAWAASSDPACRQLARVLIEPDGDGGIYAVATDGHRMSIARESIALGVREAIAIDAVGLATARTIIGTRRRTEVSVALSEHHLLVRGDGASLYLDVVNARGFPLRRPVVPASHRSEAVVNRLALMKFCDEHRGDECVRISLTPGDVGAPQYIPSTDSCRWRLTLGSEASVTGDPLRIAVNSRYLSDFLRRVGTDAVRIRGDGPIDPLVLSPVGDGAADWTYVVMPMRA